MCDFGTAKFVESHTMTGNIGTILYMSPEVLMDQVQQGMGTKVDVFSFGIIMHEVFFEKVPYRTNNEQIESVVALGTKVVQGLRPAIPDMIKTDTNEEEHAYLALMQRCWHKDPETRPSFDEIFSSLLDIQK